MSLKMLILPVRIVRKIMKKAKEIHQDYWVAAEKIFDAGYPLVKYSRKPKSRQKKRRPTAIELPAASATPRAKAPAPVALLPDASKARPVSIVVPAPVPKVPPESIPVLATTRRQEPPQVSRVARIYEWRTPLRPIVRNPANGGTSAKTPKETLLQSIEDAKCVGHMAPSAPVSRILSIPEPSSDSGKVEHRLGCSFGGCNNVFDVSKADFLRIKEAKEQGKGRPKCTEHGGYQHLLEA